MIAKVSAMWRAHVPGRLAPLALGCGILLSACGGAADAPAAGEPSTQAEPQQEAEAGEIDPCVLVTSVEATAALGEPVEPPERPAEANFPPRMVTCRYVAPRGQGVAVLTVLVRQSESDNEAQTGFRFARDQLPGASPVPGLGDEAFALANQLNVLRGRVYLNITGDVDPATARALAETALERLP